VLGVVPAREGLDAHGSAGGEIDLGLEVGHELAAGDGALEVGRVRRRGLGSRSDSHRHERVGL
jgi:hypothetical protein